MHAARGQLQEVQESWRSLLCGGIWSAVSNGPQDEIKLRNHVDLSVGDATTIPDA
jgi:hypothetical protein